MSFIEILTVIVAAVALLALSHTMTKQRRPIRKEARIEEHEASLTGIARSAIDRQRIVTAAPGASSREAFYPARTSKRGFSLR